VLGISFLAVAAWALTPDKMDEDVKERGNYGVFVWTAVTLFLAEMGDKTQILALALAAKYPNLIAMVAGTTLGTMIVNIPDGREVSCISDPPRPLGSSVCD
jgi:putative Ca2+/H+ antiporter (TMEM165/GDT1 family)